MGRIIIVLISVFVGTVAAIAQDIDSAADSIIGEYHAEYAGEVSRTRFTKEADGTYKAQVIWCRDSLDKKGNLRRDDKNPDKKKRNTPCNQIVIVWGIRHNAEKQCWDGGKIYDPTRGLRVNGMCEFIDPQTLKLKGSLFGISETLYWKKEK